MADTIIQNDGSGNNQFAINKALLPINCSTCSSEVKPHQKVYYCSQNETFYCSKKCLLKGCYPRTEHDDWIGTVVLQ